MDTREELERSALQGFAQELRALLPAARIAVQRAAAQADAATLREAHRQVHLLAASASLLSLPTLGAVAALLEQAIERIGNAAGSHQAALLAEELLEALDLAASTDIDLQAGTVERLTPILEAAQARLAALVTPSRAAGASAEPPAPSCREPACFGQAEPDGRCAGEEAPATSWDFALEPEPDEPEAALDVAALLGALTPAQQEPTSCESGAPQPGQVPAVAQDMPAPALAGAGSEQAAASDIDVLAIFSEEARTLLAEACALFEQLTHTPASADLEYELERALHTLKGAAAMVGVEPLHEAARAAELCAAGLRAVPAGRRDSALAELRAAIDVLEQHVLALPGEPELQTEAPPATEPDRAPAPVAAPLPQPALVSPPDTPGSDATPDTAVSSDQPVQAPDPELLEVFLSEAREHLAAMTLNLMALEQDPADRERLAEVRRAAHTLKGAAAATGFSAIAAYCHSIEDALDAAVERGGTCDLRLVAALSRGMGTLDELLHQAAAGATGALGESVPPFVYEPGPGAAEPPPQSLGPAGEKGALLDTSARGVLEPLAPRQEVARRAPAPRPARRSASGSVRVPVQRLETALTHAGELTVAATAQTQRLAHLVRMLGELRLMAERLSRLGRRFERQFEAYELILQDLTAGKAAPRAPWADHETGPAWTAGFDPLELDRYTELHRFGRELIEIGADVAALHRELASTARDLASLTAQQQRRALELQDGLVATRLASLEALFGRLYRSTRELAEQLGKRVELDFSGQDIEMDRAVQEAIAEALLHLLRNAVDHGIEPPAVRLAAGKPETATIRCYAVREGRDVAVTVEDDGAGIDPETVYQAAIERGLIPAGARLSPAEKLDLIFWHGVSTRREVTDISGRGVGMDVVRQIATRLQGQVQVWSEQGRGTRITLRVPASIALARVLLVRTGEEIVAVPVSPGARIVRVTPQTQAEINGTPALVLEDRLVPLLRLHELLGLPLTERPPRRGARALVLAGPRGHVALLVDDVLEQHDVLVRPLPRCMQRLPGASGVTVLADGTVALILNPAALTEATPRHRRAPTTSVPRPVRRHTVLVVDDSLSIRRIVCAAFERAGWHAVPARDGEEALALLQRVRPDLLVVDLEMPRLDGFELTARMRRQPAWRDLPIAVLTSRSGEKHRQRAAELGVNAYLTKPCPDRELIATAEALVRDRPAPADR